MAELQPSEFKKEKNPALAAFLSIFPGAGAFYNGNLFKGIVFVLVFTILIILTDNAHSADEVVFGLMIAGFYIFQIVDSYNEAVRINKGWLSHGECGKEPKEDVTLFSAVLVLAIGIVFLLANLDIITYRQISRFWPLILIVFGIKAIVGYFRKEDDKNGQQ